MKNFEVRSYLLTESKKWAPYGILFESIDGGKSNNKEMDLSQLNRFDTKEEADNFFKKYYQKKGYIEINKV